MTHASRDLSASPGTREHATSPPLQAIVIGSGFGGIGMAVALRKVGVTDFVVLEKAADVGGVWRDNTCQADIRAYLRHCVRCYFLEAYIRFHAEVAQASYDEARALWRVTLADGSALQSRLLVSATGQLSRPAIPRLDLSPLRIAGRGGLDLNDAWRHGADAYLGMTVAGFPNFFMLYGPNTNPGHNSVVSMLEGQIAHVMRCLRAMQSTACVEVEVDETHYRRFINRPGFSLSYRWRTRYSSLQAYSLSRPLAGVEDGVALAEPSGLLERANAACLRGFLRTAFRTMVGPPWGPRTQRCVATVLAGLMPGVGGVRRRRVTVGAAEVEIIAPARADAAVGAILYVHGGAYCLGGPFSHRSITTRLARESGMPVWVPDYGLAPQNPYPGPLNQVQACYENMLESGLSAGQVVFAGDSAGAALALALAVRLREAAQPMPAALMLISPVADPSLSGPSVAPNARIDPMVRKGWVEQGVRWYDCPATVIAHRPLEADLSGLPQMLIQVGDQEILLSDSTRLAEHARQCGVRCRLEVHQGRWHVFHLESFYLASARAALATLARFAKERVLLPQRAAAPRTASPIADEIPAA